MRIGSKTVLLYAVLVALVATGTAALLVDRAAALADKNGPSVPIQTSAELQKVPISKNLSLQPQALKVARRLGARFWAASPQPLL